jgi:hypothetical protein
VERVIGVVQQKNIFLYATVPISFLLTKKDREHTIMDKIAYVNCSLVNLNGSGVYIYLTEYPSKEE